jgi:peptidoglycan LD-endopeptidase LytH
VRAALVASALVLGACGGGATRPVLEPAPVEPAPSAAPLTSHIVADTGYVRSRGLMVPVLGVTPDRVADTFNDRRGGDRIHRAIDIMAPRGTPVVSADDGRIVRLSTNTLGGITIYAVDPSNRLVYYYAHLDHYDPAARVGASIAKGTVIGYVGTTGNARGGAPHLHFQVMRADGGRRYWEGTPIDPASYFATTGQDR